MSFRLVPKSVTLNDLEWRYDRYFASFQRIRVASGAHCVKVNVRYISHLLMSSCEFCRELRHRKTRVRAGLLCGVVQAGLRPNWA